MMNLTQNEIGLAASLIHAKSQLPTVSASELVKLRSLETLLDRARHKLASGGTLSRADMQRLNSALDDFADL